MTMLRNEWRLQGEDAMAAELRWLVGLLRRHTRSKHTGPVRAEAVLLQSS